MGKRYQKKKKKKWSVLSVLIIILTLACIVLIGLIMAVYVKNLMNMRSSIDTDLSKQQTQQSTEEMIRKRPKQISTEEPAEATTEEKPEIEVFENIDSLDAGYVVPEQQIDKEYLDEYFKSYEISEKVFARMKGKSYKDSCTVPRDELRYLKVLHYNFNHDIQVGELVVNERLAVEFIQIFMELFEEEYEIEKMFLVDNYDASDFASIEDNNTSCFNFRQVVGGNTLSKHATGCAIDINPIQNPYLTYNSDGTLHCEHDKSDAFLDRNGAGEHMIDYDDACYKIFMKHGFIWGGDWKNTKDYQHFQKPL